MTALALKLERDNHRQTASEVELSQLFEESGNTDIEGRDTTNAYGAQPLSSMLLTGSNQLLGW